MTDKKRTEVDWQDVRVFLALGRHGSLSAAARALSVNHATIGRRIQSLEDALGYKLVERRPEGYVLTDSGTRALAAAGDMETAVHTLSRGGSDGTPKGLVRVNGSPALMHSFLIPRLAEMGALYPGLDIDMSTDLRSVSLERHEADIAVRLGKPGDVDLIAKQAGVMGYGFYGLPAICELAEQGTLPPFVGFDEANADMPDAVWLAQAFPQARVAFRVSDQAGQAAAARAGAGMALLPHYIGRNEPKLRLCRLECTRPPREIRSVVDFILQTFSRERALFQD
jgi:molybdate transport repressor ModE-like protein